MLQRREYENTKDIYNKFIEDDSYDYKQCLDRMSKYVKQS